MANPVINPLQKESFSICDKDYLEDKIEILGASASCKMCSGLSQSQKPSNRRPPWHSRPHRSANCRTVLEQDKPVNLVQQPDVSLFSVKTVMKF